jgi:hypothetical protein
VTSAVESPLRVTPLWASSAPRDRLGQVQSSRRGHLSRTLECLRDRERYGIYIEGWLSFCRDKSALACVLWWRDVSKGVSTKRRTGDFADQTYLDDWPKRFDNVVACSTKGRIWRRGISTIYRLGGLRRNTVRVDGQTLIFFHLHALKESESMGIRPRLDRIRRESIERPEIRNLCVLSESLVPNESRSVALFQRTIRRLNRVNRVQA